MARSNRDSGSIKTIAQHLYVDAVTSAVVRATGLAGDSEAVQWALWTLNNDGVPRLLSAYLAGEPVWMAAEGFATLAHNRNCHLRSVSSREMIRTASRLAYIIE